MLRFRERDFSASWNATFCKSRTRPHVPYRGGQGHDFKNKLPRKVSVRLFTEHHFHSTDRQVIPNSFACFAILRHLRTPAKIGLSHFPPEHAVNTQTSLHLFYPVCIVCCAGQHLLTLSANVSSRMREHTQPPPKRSLCNAWQTF